MGEDNTDNNLTVTAEAVLNEVTITSGKVTNGVLVIASGYQQASVNSVDHTATLRIRSGTNAAAGSWASNNIDRTITRIIDGTGIDTGGKFGWTMIFFITGLTWASTNYVQLTAASSHNSDVGCEALNVLYL